MDEKTLYPVDFVEPEPEKKPDSPARDEAGALALIRAAVPKDGKPRSVADLVSLVAGRYVRAPGGAFLPMAGAPDASVDIAAALAALDAGQPLRGPAAFASFTHEEIEALVVKVMDERRASWKPLEAAVAELKPE